LVELNKVILLVAFYDLSFFHLMHNEHTDTFSLAHFERENGFPSGQGLYFHQVSAGGATTQSYAARCRLSKDVDIVHFGKVDIIDGIGKTTT
jgi:hypothetical protein